MRVDEPGQDQTVRQVDDVLVRMRAAHLGETSSLEDHAVAHQ